MLPEQLSTDLTSLNESADRLAVVVDMVVAGDGSVSSSSIYRALVRAGVGVMRLEPVRHSLEERFLQVTSRLDASVAPEEVKA